MSAQLTSMRQVPLVALTFSTTPAQKERRQHFDKGELKELADSIRGAGVLQAILVRPFRDEHVSGEAFEVVAGERRVLAAREAGLEEIPATVRELTDDQVIELQLIENLQRADLHELAEAEGYEQLLKHGTYSVDEIAAKVGKSRGTVYARMKLLALVPEARKAYYAGQLTASIALLLARIPVPELQTKALTEVLEGDGVWRDGAMSYREAAEHIQQYYMLRLKEAPFPTEDETLVADAGMCMNCPKNTGCSNPKLGNLELFADVKDARAGVCTDPVCFKAKREAWNARQLANAEVTGQKVITGAEAKQIAKHGTHSLSGGFVKLDERCYDDKKGRTYRQLLGKSVQPALLQVPARKEDDGGQVIEVVKRADVTEALKKKGVAPPRVSEPDNSWRDRQRAEERKQRREQTWRLEVFRRLREAAPKVAQLSTADLRAIALQLFEGLSHEAKKQLLRAWDWRSAKGDLVCDPYHYNEDDRFTKHVKAMADGDVNRFLLDCALAEDLVVHNYGSRKPEELLGAAKRAKVDPEKVRRELLAAEKAKTAPQSPKKKAARKSK